MTFQSYGFPVIRMRFELMTHALEGRCSIQLSYQTNPCSILESGAKVVHFLERCNTFT